MVPSVPFVRRTNHLQYSHQLFAILNALPTPPSAWPCTCVDPEPPIAGVRWRQPPLGLDEIESQGRGRTVGAGVFWRFADGAALFLGRISGLRLGAHYGEYPWSAQLTDAMGGGEIPEQELRRLARNAPPELSSIPYANREAALWAYLNALEAYRLTLGIPWYEPWMAGTPDPLSPEQRAANALARSLDLARPFRSYNGQCQQDFPEFLVLDALAVRDVVRLGASFTHAGALRALGRLRKAPRSVAGAGDLATTPLQKQLTGLSDGALVHFSPGEYPTVKPGAGGELFTYRYGDIKHLTPRQVETLINPLAKAGETGEARVMHVLDTTIDAATTRPGAVVPDFTEYILTEPARAPTRIPVQ